ncbi:MAG: hypothetical protein AAF824_11020 [Bacteroidota bacterium]
MISLATLFLITFCLILITPIVYALCKKIKKKAILKAFLNDILRFGLKAACIISIFVAVDGFILTSPETAKEAGLDYSQLFFQPVDAEQNLSEAQVRVSPSNLQQVNLSEIEKELSKNIQ